MFRLEFAPIAVFSGFAVNIWPLLLSARVSAVLRVFPHTCVSDSQGLWEKSNFASFGLRVFVFRALCTVLLV